LSQNDSEVVYRALVATGTLLTLDDEIKSAAKDVYGIGKSVDKAVSKAVDARIKNVAGEVRGLLK
jgi:phospholipase A-2-activating protein